MTDTKTSELPTEMTLGKGINKERTYDLVSFFKEGENQIVGHEMVEKIKKLDANLGKEHWQYVLEHQDDIPSELRGKIHFIFTEDYHPDDREFIARVDWYDDHWVFYWCALWNIWFDESRVLRLRN